jgi:hypothetical protein
MACRSSLQRSTSGYFLTSEVGGDYLENQAIILLQQPFQKFIIIQRFF